MPFAVVRGMWLRALLTKTDLQTAFRELTPVRIALDPNDHRRYVSFERPSSVEVIAGDAVYLETSGRVSWGVVGIELPITVRTLRVRAKPTIERLDAQEVIAFHLAIEHANLSSVPTFIESQVVSAINDALTARRAKLVWRFTRTLDFHFRMPETTEPRREVRLYASRGNVEVTHDGLLAATEFELAAEPSGEEVAADNDATAAVALSPEAMAAPSAALQPQERP